jgi:hypothetical protein
MSKRLTAEELARLGTLCQRATPGPWEGDDWGHLNTVPTSDSSPGWLADFGVDPNGNRHFCAAARTALPALLDEVVRLREVASAALKAQAGAAILSAYPEFRAAALAEEAQTGDDEAHRRAWDRYMAAKRALIDAGGE